MYIGKHILIVDDDPQIIMLLTHMLKKMRPEDHITAANSCQDALVRIASKKFDIIISDYSLGDGNGKNIFAQSDPNTFKVGISGSHQEHDFGSSCTRFLSKPFGMKDLQSVLEQFLHRD